MTKLGKGSFTTAYLSENQKTVFLNSVDPIKECMAYGWFPSSNLYPKIKLSDNENYDYEMKYYEKVSSLKESLKPEHWKMYQELKSISDNMTFPSNKFECSFEYIKEFKKLKNKRFSKALINGMEACMNYGTDISFEISPRNVAVNNGNLILLDCFFSLTALRTVRRS